METYAQRSIRHCLDMIAPFEGTGQQEEEGQLQFYQFMVSIYQEMYDRPEEFMVFPAPYEEYIRKQGQQKTEKKMEKAHAKNPRESTLRKTFQQAIQFYSSYFYYIGLRSKGIDQQSGALTLSKEDYSDVISQMTHIHGSEYNPDRYNVLYELGVQICENGDMVHIVHSRYKRAMEGLEFLCRAPDSKYKWMNFLRLDYKNAYSPIPTVNDICKTLSVRNSEVVKRIEENLAGMKVRIRIKPLKGIVSDFKWKVQYAHKGKNICGFCADNENLTLYIYFNHYENIHEFAGILYREDHDLFEWFKDQFPERVCQCPNNQKIFFGDEPRCICGFSNLAEIVNPDEEDLERVLMIIRKYRNLDG